MCALEQAGIVKILATRNKVKSNRGCLTALEHLISMNLFLELQQVIRVYSLFHKPRNELNKNSPQLYTISNYISLDKTSTPAQKEVHEKVMDVVLSTTQSVVMKRALPRKYIAAGEDRPSLILSFFFHCPTNPDNLRLGSKMVEGM